MRPKLAFLKQISVAAVSYLNTKPLLYGISQHPVRNQLNLVQDYPANIARMLLADEADLALIPVAMIPRIPHPHIVTDYCIGAEGPVASVCIFSEVPMEQITHVYLDYQSRTSVNLARILLQEYWQKEVILIDASGEDYRQQIKGTTAGVVIGDRALEQRTCTPFIYDLAEAWIAHTGLPFVFAAWVANKPLPPAFTTQFNEANALGLARMDEVIAGLSCATYNLDIYFKKNISYERTLQKMQGLDLFLKKLSGI